MRPGSDTYRVPQDLSQNQHIEGLPLGTVGGLQRASHVPARRRVRLPDQALSHQPEHRPRPGVSAASSRSRSTASRCTTSPSAATTIWRRCSTSRPTPATRSSAHARARAGDGRAARRDRRRSSSNLAVKDTVRLQPFLRSSADNFDWAGRPHIQTFDDHRAVQRRRARRHAEPPRDLHAAVRRAPRRERACATQILGRLARRAYRQPVGDGGARSRCSSSTTRRARRARSSAASSAGSQRILASPRFVFRVERDPGRRRAGHAVPRQRRRAGLAAVVLPVEQHPGRRAADARRARARCSSRRCSSSRCGACWPIRRPSALVSNFAGQWLQLRNVRSVQPNSDEFPDFDDNLRQAFRRETELLFESIMREDRSVLDLLRADYTFVNERLARHYGIPDVYGSQLPPRAGDRRRAPRAARARQHPDGDVARRADVAGAARQVDAREPARPAAAAAAARRAAAQAATTKGRSRRRCASRWRSTAPTRPARAATR